MPFNRLAPSGRTASATAAAALLGVLLAAAAVGAHDDQAYCGRHRTGRVIGGWASGINEYPMVAGLVFPSPLWVFCAGTIVSNRYAVTAGHCVEKASPSAVRLMVGTNDYSKFPDTPYSKLYDVDRFIMHPQFKSVANNDVALVRTQQQIEYNAAVGHVCLPYDQNQFAGQVVTMMGWGKTSNNGALSSVLQKTLVNVMSNTDCQYYHGSLITSQILCTFTQGRDLCQHDSGGPLFAEIGGSVYLIGILDFLGCLQGKPGGSMRVSNFGKWIYDNSRY